MTPQRPPLEEMTLRQLRRVASACKVSRYSRMRKSELQEAIRQAERAQQLTQETAPAPIMEEKIAAVPAQETVEAAKFDVGQDKSKSAPLVSPELADVDAGLAELPEGYGDSRIVMLPRDPQWSYVYWDVPNDYRESKRQQGGTQLALRLYDITDISEGQRPHSMQEYSCDETAREWYVPIPVSDRDYTIELGYRCDDGRWLNLVTSARIHIPPVYPSDWVADQFITVNWDESLEGRTVYALNPPKVVSESSTAAESEGIYGEIFGMAGAVEAQRVAGSLYGSMQQAPVSGLSAAPESMSSYMLAAGSGIGMWGNASGAGFTASGAGIAASMPPVRPRKFWLIADAELIVYGATEPDAMVTIGGEPITLNPDGTFRYQMSFQDGVIDYPILAVAADGVQTRSIHMNFERQTPSRNTNTKAEAVEELIP